MMTKKTLVLLIGIILFTIACTPSSNSAKMKADLIKTNDELFHKGNLDYADEIFASDYAGRGPEFIKELVRNLKTAFPDLQVEVDPIVAEGKMLGWRRIHTGTHQGAFGGFEPTGKKITWEAVILTQIEDSKVAKEWASNNLMEVLQKEADLVNKEAEGEELMQRSRDWSDLVKTGDMDAVLEVWAEDAVMMAPGLPPLKGKAAIKEYVEAGAEVPGFSVSWEPLEAHISSSGDMAYLIEQNQMTVNDSMGNPVTTHNKVVTVWRKEADGTWKNVIDMWNEEPTRTE